MAYTPPSGSSITLNLSEGGYVAPSTTAANFDFIAPSITGTLSSTFDPVDVTVVGTVTLPATTGTLSSTLDSVNATVAGTFTAYTPPAGNSIFFDFTEPYTAPDSLSANISFAGEAFTGTLASTLDSIDATVAGTVALPATTGTLSSTLASVDATLAGTVTAPAITGTLSSTLAPVDATIAGSVGGGAGVDFEFTAVYSPPSSDTLDFHFGTPPQPSGVLSSILDPVDATLAGTVTVPAITGTLNTTLASVDATVAGTITLPAITGVLSGVLDSVHATVAGTVTAPAITGTLSSTLTPVNVTLVGSVEEVAGVSLNFIGAYTAPTGDSVQLSFGAAPEPSGVLDSTLEPFVTLLSGTVTAPAITGTLAANLDHVDATVVGTVTSPAITGILSSALDSVDATVVGTVTAPATTGTLASTLDSVDTTIAGTITTPATTGTLTAALSNHTTSIVASYQEPEALVLNLDEIYTPPTGSNLAFNIGGVEIQGTLSSTLDSHTVSIAGDYQGPILGTLTSTLHNFTSTLAAEHTSPPISGNVSSVLQDYDSSIAGSITLPPPDFVTFVATSTSGNMTRSNDGITWTKMDGTVTGFSFETVRSVATDGQGLWVTVGRSGTVATSVDGQTWTQRTGANGTNEIYDVAYGDGLWVTIDSTGGVATSPDGINWTARGTVSGYNAVAYGDGLWVSVGPSNAISTSPDGINWTNRTSVFGSSNIHNIAYHDGLWVAVGDSNKVVTSPDGINWTMQSGGHGTTIVSGVAYADGQWITVGGNSTIATSPDGITWTSRIGVHGTDLIRSVSYSLDARLWVAAGNNGKLSTSPDGITWTLQNSQLGSGTIYSVSSFRSAMPAYKAELAATLGDYLTAIQAELVYTGPYEGSIAAVLESDVAALAVTFTPGSQGSITAALEDSTATFVTTFTPVVRVEHTSSYSLILAADHSAPYGTFVATSNTAGYALGLNRLLAEHSTNYNLSAYDPVVADHVAVCTLPVMSHHIAPYQPTSVVTEEHTGVYSLNQLITTQFEGPYDSIGPVGFEHKHPYDLLAYNRVLAEHRSFYSLMSPDVVNITGQPNISVEGEIIEIAAARVWTDEGDFTWQAIIQLADLGDYVKLRRDMPFTLNIYGEHYNLIVDIKNLSRDAPASVSANFTGSSPGVKHTAPRSEPITKTFETAVLASQAVSELLGGEVVDWQMIDWVIPAYRLAVEEADPIESAKMIIEAAGGVLESKKDGTLLARKLFPVSIPDYALATVNHTYTDILDNLSVSEQFDINTLYNRYRITDVKTEVADRVDFVADDDGLGGILRAYPSPWRTNIILKHTWDTRITLFPLGEEIREEESLVEFTEGEGTTAFPILSIVSIEWMSQPLGGLVFDPYTEIIRSTHEVRKYGLARIKYKVKSINYRTFAPAGTSVQYVIEDLGSEASLEVPSV